MKPDPNKPWVIYTLVDPIKQTVKYVGVATQRKRNCSSGSIERQRMKEHLWDARAGNPGRNNNWIRSLLRKSLKPDYCLVERGIGDDKWEEAEIWWIKLYRNLGFDLTNMTDGGRGCDEHGIKGKHIIPLIERALKHVLPEPMSGCWLWSSTVDKGYATISVNGRLQRANRIIYALIKGEIPTGMELLYKCRVRCCVNPDHMEPVPMQRVRSLRGKLKTHCPRGHEYTEENTRLAKTYCGFSRQCRLCPRQKRRERGLKPNPWIEFQRARTHCLRGHELIPENILRYGGQRQCKACNMIRARARREKQKLIDHQ